MPKRRLPLKIAMKAVAMSHHFPSLAPGHGGTHGECVNRKCVTHIGKGGEAHTQNPLTSAVAFLTPTN
ncbi:MAG: hypothetical protein HZC14_00935 [Candidatus Niyogibacteria bacterium]|nr:hypothetical protein [Candidatus Niyogibacteria bacterium]